MTDKRILQAYRNLYRNALLATHRSTPAKYVVRETIRKAFRIEPAHNFNPQRVKNTEEFLKRAEQDNGMEHRILKNLVHVRYWQHHARRDNKLYACTELVLMKELIVSAGYSNRHPWLHRFAKRIGLNMTRPWLCSTTVWTSA